MKFVVATLLTTALMGAGATSAGAGRGADPPEFELDFVSLRLGKVEGKTVQFSASTGLPKGSITRSAQFSVFTDDQQLSYAVRGKNFLSVDDITDGGEIDADFGELGKVEGEFEVKDADDDGDDKCEPFSRLKATFSGMLRLKAENDLVSVEKTKARGYVLHGPDADCDSADEPEGGERRAVKKGDVLSACAEGVQYSAIDRGRFGYHGAYVKDRIGKVDVFRGSYSDGSEKSFQHDDDHTSATVKPGGPFSGTGVYADGRLTGDLAVDLLGLPDPVALTPAKANLRQGNRPDKCSQID